MRCEARAACGGHSYAGIGELLSVFLQRDSCPFNFFVRADAACIHALLWFAIFPCRADFESRG
jgi:hypothetical protein